MGFNNHVAIDDINETVNSVCDDIIGVLNHHAGPWSFDAVLMSKDAISNDSYLYTKDGKHIVSSLKYNDGFKELLRSQICEVGNIIEKYNGDGTTTAMLMACHLVKALSSVKGRFRNFRHLIKCINERTEVLVDAMQKSDFYITSDIFNGELKNPKQAFGWMQAYSSSHGDGDLAAAIFDALEYADDSATTISYREAYEDMDTRYMCKDNPLHSFICSYSTVNFFNDADNTMYANDVYIIGCMETLFIDGTLFKQKFFDYVEELYKKSGVKDIIMVTRFDDGLNDIIRADKQLQNEFGTRLIPISYSSMREFVKFTDPNRKLHAELIDTNLMFARANREPNNEIPDFNEWVNKAVIEASVEIVGEEFHLLKLGEKHYEEAREYAKREDVQKHLDELRAKGKHIENLNVFAYGNDSVLAKFVHETEEFAKRLNRYSSSDLVLFQKWLFDEVDKAKTLKSKTLYYHVDKDGARSFKDVLDDAVEAALASLRDGAFIAPIVAGKLKTVQLLDTHSFYGELATAVDNALAESFNSAMNAIYDVRDSESFDEEFTSQVDGSFPYMAYDGELIWDNVHTQPLFEYIKAHTVDGVFTPESHIDADSERYLIMQPQKSISDLFDVINNTVMRLVSTSDMVIVGGR